MFVLVLFLGYCCSVSVYYLCRLLSHSYRWYWCVSCCRGFIKEVSLQSDPFQFLFLHSARRHRSRSAFFELNCLYNITSLFVVHAASAAKLITAATPVQQKNIRQTVSDLFEDSKQKSTQSRKAFIFTDALIYYASSNLLGLW